MADSKPCHHPILGNVRPDMIDTDLSCLRVNEAAEASAVEILIWSYTQAEHSVTLADVFTKSDAKLSVDFAEDVLAAPASGVPRHCR